jgi:hypothetical protein
MKVGNCFILSAVTFMFIKSQLCISRPALDEDKSLRCVCLHTCAYVHNMYSTPSRANPCLNVIAQFSKCQLIKDDWEKLQIHEFGLKG